MTGRKKKDSQDKATDGLLTAGMTSVEVKENLLTKAFAKARQLLADKKRRPIVLSGLAIFVLIVAGSVAGYQQYANRPVCSDELLQQAAAFYNPSQTLKLKTIVNKVTSLKRYERDPNCLNIVVTYYINVGDSTNAHTYLDKLQKVYNPKKGFSQYLDGKVRTIDTLRQNVDYLDHSRNELFNNIQGLKQVD
jgi:hypothetical protein